MEADTSQPGKEADADANLMASSSNNINLNDYKGFEPPLGVTSSIDRVPIDISPQEFYEKYIQARKPVIIEQHFKDAAWKGSLWNNGYLKEKAGQAEVLVEKRIDDKDGMFGLSAPKVNMKYGEFLEQVDKKSEQYYLTTQDLERFPDDLDDFEMPKSVVAEPLKSLKDDFPVCPSLMGNLVPYQVSLWQGNSRNGSSSGLHHDFHDNLYVLIRGRKRFRLFPPSLAPHMSTMGRPIKIHPNGLIVYQSQPVNPTVNIRADGVPLAFLARRKRIEAEQELALAEEELYAIQDATRIPEEVKRVEIKRLQGIILDCEDRIDLAMEEMLQYGNTFDYDFCSDTDVISVHGDDSELDDDLDNHKDEPDGSKEGGKDNEDAKDQPPTKVMRLANGSRAIINTSQDSKENGDTEKILKIPDHFCNIVLPTNTDDPETILSMFPEKELMRCLSVVLGTGEMLYLPASWFHEVTSYCDALQDAEAEQSDADVSGHLALNYWMFPPDGDAYDTPYRDDFWPKRWEAIQEEKDTMFTLGNKPRYSRADESGDVINLDSDSDDEGDDDDYDDDDDSDDAILVGDDSLTTENDDSIVIESQLSSSRVTHESAIDLDTSGDLSGSGSCLDDERSVDGNEKDSDASVSDGILDSSNDDEAKAAGDGDDCQTEKSQKSSDVLEAAPSTLVVEKTTGNLAEADSSVALDSSENGVFKTNGSGDHIEDSRELDCNDIAQEINTSDITLTAT